MIVNQFQTICNNVYNFTNLTSTGTTIFFLICENKETFARKFPQRRITVLVDVNAMLHQVLSPREMLPANVTDDWITLRRNHTEISLLVSRKNTVERKYLNQCFSTFQTHYLDNYPVCDEFSFFENIPLSGANHDKVAF